MGLVPASLFAHFRTIDRVRVLAGAAVAFYRGMETLTHLDGDRSRPAILFDQAPDSPRSSTGHHA